MKRRSFVPYTREVSGVRPVSGARWGGLWRIEAESEIYVIYLKCSVLAYFLTQPKSFKKKNPHGLKNEF